MAIKRHYQQQEESVQVRFVNITVARDICFVTFNYLFGSLLVIYLVGPRGQQLHLGAPAFPLPSNISNFLLGDPEAIPSQFGVLRPFLNTRTCLLASSD